MFSSKVQGIPILFEENNFENKKWVMREVVHSSGQGNKNC